MPLLRRLRLPLHLLGSVVVISVVIPSHSTSLLAHVRFHSSSRSALPSRLTPLPLSLAALSPTVDVSRCRCLRRLRRHCSFACHRFAQQQLRQRRHCSIKHNNLTVVLCSCPFCRQKPYNIHHQLGPGLFFARPPARLSSVLFFLRLIFRHRSPITELELLISSSFAQTQTFRCEAKYGGQYFAELLCARISFRLILLWLRSPLWQRLF